MISGFFQQNLGHIEANDGPVLFLVVMFSTWNFDAFLVSHVKSAWRIHNICFGCVTAILFVQDGCFVLS